jgi:hypothetical protein
VERAGLTKHGVDERGLAVVDVRDDRDVPKVFSAEGHVATHTLCGASRKGSRSPSMTISPARRTALSCEVNPMRRLALVLLFLPGCALPNLNDLFGQQAPLKPGECRHSDDCAADELCDTGKCRKIGSEGEGSQGGEGEGEGEGDVVDPRGPQFLQYSTNITSMGPEDTLIFTVVVTHPDGIQNVVGGSLVDPGSGASYGAFTTLSTTGSYQLSLSWEALNEVAAIDFSTSAQRSFQARFFDQAGHVSSESLSITLTCGGTPACAGSCGAARCGDGTCTTNNGSPDTNGNGICNNTCENLTTTSACGSCGNVCSTGSCGDVNGTVQCACTSGFQCGFGDACVDSTCETASIVQPSTPSNFTPQATMNGSTFDLCLDNNAATLFCQQAGFSSGSAVTQVAFSGFGAQANCSTASSLAGCTWTSGDCEIAPVDCGSTTGGQDLSCATDGSVPVGSFLQTTISGRSSVRSATCEVSSGAEAIYTFTASTTQSFEFVAFGGDQANELVLTILNDCGSVSAQSPLSCSADTTSASEATSTISLSAGQTVVAIVDTTFTPSAQVGLEVLAQ